MDILIKRLVISLFIASSAVSYALGSDKKTRTVDEYSSSMKGQSFIAIIGTGHKVKEYPKKYFLLDWNSTQQPDMIADICKPLPQELEVLKGKFDKVILEHLPMNCLPSGMTNIASLLKSGGDLVFNNICTVDRMADQEDYDNATETLMENVKYVKIDPQTKYAVGKAAFVMYINPPANNKPNNEDIVGECVKKVLDPFLESYHFSKTKKAEIPEDTAFKSHEEILSATKK